MNKIFTVFTMITFFIFLLNASPLEAKVLPRKVQEKANIAYSLWNYQGNYKIHIIYSPKPQNMDIQFMSGDKIVYSFKGGPQTVFTIYQDVLYYADYNRISSGCSIIAYDFKNKKKQWETKLMGLGPIGHSEYFNYVDLSIDPAPYDSSNHSPIVVSIFANEAAGDYAEFLDLKTGKTLHHVVFK